ncbi:MAG: hypothetical protein R2843_11240 [Thermomicrobiales bacterium]
MGRPSLLGDRTEITYCTPEQSACQVFGTFDAEQVLAHHGRLRGA